MKKLRNSGNNDQDLLNNLKLHETPFSVPEEYFHNLTDVILQKKDIKSNSDKTWSVPPNYQQELTNDILLKVSEAKLKSTVAADGLTVPTGYFDQLHSSILKKTTQEDGKIVSFPKRRKLSWFRYTSAACIALAVSIFAFYQLSDEEVEPTTAQVEDIIDEIPDDEIINYLTFYSEPSDYLILSEELSEESTDFKDTFSSEEIESYLENSI